MTFKKKSNVPINTISSTSGEFSQGKFTNSNSFINLGRNNRGRFSTSNRSYNKRIYPNVRYFELIILFSLFFIVNSFLYIFFFTGWFSKTKSCKQ